MTVEELKNMSEEEFFNYVKKDDILASKNVKDLSFWITSFCAFSTINGGLLGFILENLANLAFKDERDILPGTVILGVLGLITGGVYSVKEIKEYVDSKKGLKQLKSQLNGLSDYELDNLKQMAYDKKFKNNFVNQEKLQEVYSNIKNNNAIKVTKNLDTLNYGVASNNSYLSKISDGGSFTYGVKKPVKYKDDKSSKKELEKILGM